MCGIFGVIGRHNSTSRHVTTLVEHSIQRGQDSSGLIWQAVGDQKLNVSRAGFSIKKLRSDLPRDELQFVAGHSRLITNGMLDNQPVVLNGIAVLHNGIITNHLAAWGRLNETPKLEIDTEIIARLAELHVKSTGSLNGVFKHISDYCLGSMSCAVISLDSNEIALFSNTGSLYVGNSAELMVFSSERFPLAQLGYEDILQLHSEKVVKLPLPESFEITDKSTNRPTLVPKFHFSDSEFRILEHHTPDFRRCARCILPETMPFITFGQDGVCNYCSNYQIRNAPKPIEALNELLSPYRRRGTNEAIMPFSGGRDSSYALHLARTELDLRVIAYTYDWGMVTDLGRRNISRMCASLGVENIVVAADIAKKRRNIKMNLEAWLQRPHLGMISLLTAGDKHFFRFIEDIKSQNDIQLNIWGINPLETTHFKAGFLGIPPSFETQTVYSSGLIHQLRYQSKRMGEYARNPRYLNSSIYDTLTGEYYRSLAPKKDYFHMFDYWKWDEREIDKTLITDYGWETANDTSTTWRIGDGTAAFYNYVYFVVAGFSEHDTFRSNQIREGDLSRDEALRLVELENKPRYENIRWYLDAVGVDFTDAIGVVNAIPKLWSS